MGPKTGHKRRKIGLALGGGGARGLAHIGVLKVLDRENIPIHMIAGTSIGALIGAAFSGGTSPEELQEKVEAYLHSPKFQSSAIKAIEDANAKGELTLGRRVQSFFRNRYFLVQAMLKPGLFPSRELQEIIEYFVPDIQIEETKIPFRALATDLVRGTQILFSSGSLRQAVIASCAVPGAIAPVKVEDRLLSDGGIICLIPCTVVRKEGADVVIAVSVDRDICTKSEFATAVRIYQRVSDIMCARLKDHELAEADVVIAPMVGDLHWSEFSQALTLIDEGEKAAFEKLDLIRSAVPRSKHWFNLKDLFKSHAKPSHPVT
ncbi:MAG: patatin-like phospholipase family protein [Deltaproteobacteria bacterium]|nr:patatin-like phospholipase family protein [Deltaproteobacteria bacterium]